MPNKIDLYLNRVSQLSQLFLVGFAIFGYFYTVRPLYQNASLQESIAKKEVELKNLQLKTDELYFDLRKELIRKFVFGVTYDCSPATPFMMQPSQKTFDNPKPLEAEMAEFKASFEKDPYNCLMESIGSSLVLKGLRATDKDKLIQTFEELKPKFTELRTVAIQHFADKNYLLITGKENSVNMKELEEYLSKNYRLTDEQKKDFENTYISAGAFSVISEYGTKFNNLVIDSVTIKK